MSKQRKTLKRCAHDEVEVVNNGDWEWLECTKCGKKISDEEAKDYK